MDPNLKTAVAKQSKILAQQSAKQISQEPLELAKNVGRQVTGLEAPMPPLQPPFVQEAGPKAQSPPDEQKIKERGERVLQALESELKDIRIQNLFEDIQTKIASGELINLSNYPELTQKQKEALNSQMKAITQQKSIKEASTKPLVEPETKRPRKFLAGMQGQVDKLRRKAEIRMPPTG